MLKARSDYKCKLIGTDGKELLKFDASSVDNLTGTTSFVGGGIASAGQTLTIWTEKSYKYKAGVQSVVIGNNTYKLMLVTTGMRKKLGASCLSKIVPIYILYLE